MLISCSTQHFFPIYRVFLCFKKLITNVTVISQFNVSFPFGLTTSPKHCTWSDDISPEKRQSLISLLIITRTKSEVSTNFAVYCIFNNRCLISVIKSVTIVTTLKRIINGLAMQTASLRVDMDNAASFSLHALRFCRFLGRSLTRKTRKWNRSTILK